MVQFLSIIFLSWISSIFVRFFKSSFFVCHPVLCLLCGNNCFTLLTSYWKYIVSNTVMRFSWPGHYKHRTLHKLILYLRRPLEASCVSLIACSVLNLRGCIVSILASLCQHSRLLLQRKQVIKITLRHKGNLCVSNIKQINTMHLGSDLYYCTSWLLYMFRALLAPIIRSTTVRAASGTSTHRMTAFLRGRV